jgi:PE-PPE domain
MAVVTVLVVGGTGESYRGDTREGVSGLLAEVTGRLDERFNCQWVGYPASYGPVPDLTGMSYLDSVRAGVENLQARLDATPGPVMMIGYSQGAVVIRQLLANRESARAVVAVGFVADPHQPPGVVAGCEGFGLAGDGPAIPTDVPVMWIADPADVICNASRDSLLRDFADLTAAMSVSDVRGWFRSLWEILRGNDFQNAMRTSIGPRQWRKDVRRVRIAMAEIAGYLPRKLMWRGLQIVNRAGGRHTAYDAEPLAGGTLSGCEILAQWLQVQVTFLPSGIDRRVA